MTRLRLCLTAFVACAALTDSNRVAAQAIVLRSGNGAVGANDSSVKMLVGPVDSAFGSAFTAADFTSARTGAAAPIITPNSAWISSLAGDSTSKWISTNPTGAVEGSSALFAIDFTLPAGVTSATLSLNYAVDNQLGSAVNQGVFLNGTAISGSSVGGNFIQEFSLTRSDIGPLLVAGTNTLYLNMTDFGGPSGLLFRATITPVPEPTGLLVGGLGLAAAVRLRRAFRRPTVAVA